MSSKFSSVNLRYWLCAAPFDFLKYKSSEISCAEFIVRRTKERTFALATPSPSDILAWNSCGEPPLGFSRMSPLRTLHLNWQSASTSNCPAAGDVIILDAGAMPQGMWSGGGNGDGSRRKDAAQRVCRRGRVLEERQGVLCCDRGI